MQTVQKVVAAIALVAGGIGVASLLDQRSVSASLPEVEENVVKLAEGDTAMAKARDAARETFDGFWAYANGPEASELDAVSIKVGIPHANGSEHIWTSGCRSADAKIFSCTISNDPVDVPLKLGERYAFERAAISDWMYRRDGKIHGGYSIRALLPTMPDDQRDALAAMLAPLEG